MWWGMVVAFIGIVFVLNPGKEIFQFGAMFGLLAGICSAVAFVFLRMSYYSDTVERTLFYNFGIATIAMLVVSLFFFPSVWLSLDAKSLLWLSLIGLLALLAQIMIANAAKHAPLRLLGPFFYLTVVFSMILDYWIWDNPLTEQIAIGFFLVLIGNVLMIVLYPKDDLQIRK